MGDASLSSAGAGAGWSSPIDARSLADAGHAWSAIDNALITIDTITIKQDSEGRYCLNDLHKAAGGDPAKAPAQWLRWDSAKDLILTLTEENMRNHTISPMASTRGRNGGTFVAKELVYAYAMWISPAFHLKVIRAYDQLATQGVALHEDHLENFNDNPLKYFRKLLEQAEERRIPCHTLLLYEGGRNRMSFWTKYRLAGLALYIGFMVALLVLTNTDLGEYFEQFEGAAWTLVVLHVGFGLYHRIKGTE